MMQQVPVPTGSDVLGHLGWSTDPDVTTQADQHVAQVALACRAYVRGRGWEKSPENVWTVAEDQAVVIISACARSLSNPDNSRRVEAGSYNAVPGSFEGWSLIESYVLNGYRKRAA